MNIYSLSSTFLSSKIMLFNTDEISNNALLDPFVKTSDLSNINPEISVIYSPNKDVNLSVNGQFARPQVTSEPMTHWYDINTNIIYHNSGNNEPDGIKTIIFSKSEKCYYLGTTEGLYRTYNDDFSNCERILANKIIAQSTTDAVETQAHITNIVEIGTGLYALSITGKTNATVCYAVYDSINNKLFNNKTFSAKTSGWRMANKLISVTDTNATIAFTSTDEANIIDIVSIDKIAESIIVKNISVDGLANKNNATHFMEEFNQKMFFSHHYSDNTGSNVKQYLGLDYTDLSNITSADSIVWTSDMVHSVPELSNCRIYQIRTINDALYVCCGLSGNNNDSLGLYKITLDDNNIPTCQSLVNDRYLSSFTCAKDIYYSESANKWSFCLSNLIYIADDNNGNWTELYPTGYSVGQEAYPRFNEFSNLVTIYANDGQQATMYETSTTQGGFVALLDDIKTKNIKVNGAAIDPDEHGFIDLPLNDMIENYFQIVDEIPTDMKNNVIYFVKKRS